MRIDLLGAVLVIFSCSTCGLRIATGYRKEYRQLQQLTHALSEMESELQYRLTVLPELVAHASSRTSGELREILLSFSENLTHHQFPDAGSCMQSALSSHEQLSERVLELLEFLGLSLGRFDLSGQLNSLHQLEYMLEREMKLLEQDLPMRLRCYRILGICTGIGLSVILL